jgi:hypothetical protein
MGENCDDYDAYIAACERANIDPGTLKPLDPLYSEDRTGLILWDKITRTSTTIEVQDHKFSESIFDAKLSLANKTISMRIWENKKFEVTDWLCSLQQPNTEKIFITVRDEDGDKVLVKYQLLDIDLDEHEIVLQESRSVFGIDLAIDPLSHAVVLKYNTLDRIPVDKNIKKD